jgi:prepilin-type processing-associated H-X9-DG protein
MACPDTNASTPHATTHAALAQQLASPAYCSYVYCGAGQTPSADAGIVLAYEPLANHSNDGMNALFGDGHVEFVFGGGARSILAQTAQGVRSPRLEPTTLPTALNPAATAPPASTSQPAAGLRR